MWDIGFDIHEKFWLVLRMHTAQIRLGTSGEWGVNGQPANSGLPGNRC